MLAIRRLLRTNRGVKNNYVFSANSWSCTEKTSRTTIKRGNRMAVQVTNLQNDRTIEVATTGKLTRADYDEFVPIIESEMKQGKVKILFSMHDFSGWDVGALWEDIKFDMKHFGEIERVAMVGEKKCEQGMAWFCKPFTTAKIAYFDQSEIDAARSWLQGK